MILPCKIKRRAGKRNVCRSAGKFGIGYVQFPVAFEIQIRFHNPGHVYFGALDTVAAGLAGNDLDVPMGAQVIQPSDMVTMLMR